MNGVLFHHMTLKRDIQEQLAGYYSHFARPSWNGEFARIKYPMSVLEMRLLVN